MKKAFIFIAIALFAAGTATAQDDITKQMEVTKAYTPKVGRAAKLPVEPRMVDTVQLRPDIEYTITPTAWQTVFETEPYNPARISVTPYEKNRPLYLRVGAGYPLQSTADIYFNPYIGNRSTFGMFINHRGQFSKIANERGQKLNSTEMLNGAGLYGTKHFRRYKLEGDFGYENRLHNPYGVFPEIEGVPASAYTGGADAIDFGRAVGNISFGDSFADLGRFNFRVGLRAGYFHNSLPYRSCCAVRTRGQADIDLWVKAARMYGGKHGFEAGIYERGALGLGHFSGTNNFGVMFDPKYVLSLPKFGLRAGVDLIYLYDGIDKSGSVMPLPHIDARLNIAKGYFTPYLSGKGQITDGSTAALSFRNPFADGWGVPGWRYDLRLGFRGGVNSVFSYNLWGGISQLENYSVLTPANRFSVDAAGNAAAALDGPVLFAPLTDDVTCYTAGADIQIATAAGFSARLYGDWYSYDPKRLPVVDGLPGYDAGLELKYAHKELFTLSAGAKYVGGRKSLFYLADASNPLPGMSENIITGIPAAVDVTLAAEVKVTKGLWIFAEGRNLANQRLYPYSYYPGVGANVMAGIKAVF